MKSYLVMIAISTVLAHNVGTTYGEIVNSLFGDIVVKLERVQRMVR